LLGADHPDTLRSMNNLAAAYVSAGRLDKALPLHEETLKLRQAKLGPEHPDTLRSMHDLALAFMVANRSLEAEPILRELVAIQRRRLPAKSPELAAHLASLGKSLVQVDEHAEAELILRECLAIREKTLPEDWRRFKTQSLLGGSLLGQKKYAEAEPLLLSGYEGMKARQESIPASAKDNLREALEWLVKLHEALGQPEKAAERRLELDRERPPARN
jgi:eukaryotic-like serine/threonine-protein kinase